MATNQHAIVDIEVTPLGTQTTTIKDYVIAAEEVLNRYPALKFEINPMSTTIEGDLETIFHVLHEMHEAPFQKGAKRVLTSIRIDDRRDGIHESMAERVQVVKEKIKMK